MLSYLQPRRLCAGMMRLCSPRHVFILKPIQRNGGRSNRNNANVSPALSGIHQQQRLCIVGSANGVLLQSMHPDPQQRLSGCANKAGTRARTVRPNPNAHNQALRSSLRPSRCTSRTAVRNHFPGRARVHGKSDIICLTLTVCMPSPAAGRGYPRPCCWQSSCFLRRSA